MSDLDVSAVAVGERIAPGELALVQAFVNTNDREGGDDVFADRAGVAGWFARAGLPSPGRRLDEPSRARVIALREAIRDLVRDGDAGPLESALAALPMTVAVRDGRVALVGTDPVTRAVAPVADALRTAMDQPERWRRLKVCDRDRCQWLFYDSSRNNASRWCRTDLCGSREKARRAYLRARG